MSATLNPYISFRDEAREAMTFYQSVFGGELTLNTFGEAAGGEEVLEVGADDPTAADDPAERDNIMHGQLVTGDGMTLMAADTPPGMEHQPGSQISISLSGGPEDEERLQGCWELLSGSGTVIVPLEKAPWGDSFGMCTDQFGIGWMVNIGGSAQ